MDSKQASRRKFLKGGAAVAGLAAGAVRSASGQTPAPAAAPAASPAAAPAKNLKELIAYGERSKFVTSIREPAQGRPSPDAFGLTFHVVTPLGESVGIMTPS